MRFFRRPSPSWTARDNNSASPVAGERADLPYLAGRRAFLSDHVLLHTHIPKTGGSTLAQGLSSIVGAVHAMDLRLNRHVPVREMTQDDLDELHLLSGHFAFGDHPDFGRTPLYIAAVREPVARAVSDYRFLSSRSDHGSHHLVAGKDFETAWAAQAVALGAAFHNLQSHYLAGAQRGRGVDPAGLWQRIEEDYFLVIPQTELTRTIQALRSAFGVPWARIADHNRSRGHEPEVTPDMRRRILDANPLDARLFDRVTADFDRRLDRACDYIASRCLLPLKDAQYETEDT